MVKRILVVEDDEAIRRMQERILSSAGYEVTEAGSGEEALKLLDGHLPPDAALLDVMMPGLSGLEVSRRIRQNPRYARLPVIFVTARSDAEAMNAGYKAGADLYLSKPFSAEKLLRMVRALVPAHGE